MIYVIIGVIFWIVCGVFGYGLCFAGSQKAFPNLAERDYKRDRWLARWIFITGPIGLMIGLSLDGGKYGLKFK